MGMRVSKCEAVVDPTIIVPPPPPSATFGGSPGGGGSVGGSSLPESSQSPPPPPDKFKNNPGTFEDVHKRCKELFPQPFEGAKLIVNKGLNQGFQVSHSLTLSSITPSGYRFGATYLGTSMISPSEPGTILAADTDPSGNLNAQGIHSVSDFLKFRFASQIVNSKFSSVQFTTDLKGKDWTGSLTIANPNVFNETGVLSCLYHPSNGIAVFHFLQGITPKFALGAELMYQRSPQIPGGSATLLSCTGRYTGDASVWSGYGGTNGAGVCYYRKLSDELQVGMEVESSFQQQQPQMTVASVGYQYDISKANFTMKGMIDTNWTVTGVFEKRLLPMPFMLTMCGSMNHVKNQFRIGCGFSIGG